MIATILHKPTMVADVSQKRGRTAETIKPTEKEPNKGQDIEDLLEVSN